MKADPTKTFFPCIFYPCIASFLVTVLLVSRIRPFERHAAVFGILCAVGFLLLIYLFKTFPVEWPRRRQLLFIGCASLLCHVFFLNPSPREQRQQTEGYQKAVNHSIHGAGRQWRGAELRLTEEIRGGDIFPGNKQAGEAHRKGFHSAIDVPRLQQTRFSQYTIGLVNVATLFVLALMLGRRKTPPAYLVFYALNPLIIISITAGTQTNAIAVFFLCFSLWLFTHQYDHWGFLSLGCAIAFNFLALVFFPFLISSKNWGKSLIAFIPLLLVIVSPLVGLENRWLSFFLTLPFSQNHFPAALLWAALGAVAPWACIFLLLCCLWIVFVLVHDPLRSCYLAAGSVLFILPLAQPWALILMTPFLVFFPSKAWLYLHFAGMCVLPWTGNGIPPGIPDVHFWAGVFQYLPFVVFLAHGLWRPSGFSMPPQRKPVRCVSVVVPTLNEAEYLTGALDSLKEQTGFVETIIVDGGSSDGTQKLAEKMGARVISWDLGRGLQISKGVSEAQGDVVLILHADCRLRPGALQRVLDRLNTRPQHSGGALGMQYRPGSFQCAIIACLNNARARWAGISFGDQGQFFRKEAISGMGQYPRQMLMEDVEFSMRMKESGPMAFIPRGIWVSKRRWENVGFFENTRRVVAYCLTYLIKRRLGLEDECVERLYHRYYRNES